MKLPVGLWLLLGQFLLVQLQTTHGVSNKNISILEEEDCDDVEPTGTDPDEDCDDEPPNSGDIDSDCDDEIQGQPIHQPGSNNTTGSGNDDSVPSTAVPSKTPANVDPPNVQAEPVLPPDSGSDASTGPKNLVEWETGPCWNFFQNATDVCGEGGIRLKGERLNVERYVGAACNCDEYSLGMDGFNCPIQCDRKKDADKMTECRQQRRECQIDRKDQSTFCGCPIGEVYKKMTGGNNYCEKVDSCKTCQHKCHKASKCLPATSGSRTGYNCAPCNPKFGYRGDGFSCENIDECSDDKLNDCDHQNGAFCDDRDPVYDDGLKYECTCPQNWLGDPQGGYKWRPCKDTDECALNKTLCGEFGICKNTPGSFLCDCKPGFVKKQGSRTECVDVNECLEDSPCHQMAVCQNTVGSFTCECKEGFKGDGISECTPDKDFWCKKCDEETTVCQLTDKGDGYACNCKSGFGRISGVMDMCTDILECSDPNLNECDKNPGRAACVELPGSYKCECNKGYEGDGKKCTPSDPCEISYPCSTIAGTKCVNNNGQADCVCKDGFVRQLADVKNHSAPCYDINTSPVNNCTICDNSTTECQKSSQDSPFYECVCKTGYKRNAAGKCVNINECQKPADNNCDDNAFCLDKEPAIDGKRFECRCKPGFDGDGTLDHCEDHDECKNASLNACPDPNTLCVNTIGSYTCDCREGYRKLQGSGVCANVNECEEGLSKCPLMAKCIDQSPGYGCLCLTGFKNDTDKDGKFDCSNIDECTEGLNQDKSVSACDKDNGLCTDTLGSFLCSCKDGFTKGYDQQQCVDIDECKLGTAVCNSQVEECENTIGSYKCNCKYGMVSNPQTGRCEDRDECKDGSNKCNKNSVCENTFASYKCSCASGFKPKVGTHPLRPVCEREDVCVKNPTVCAPGQCESTDDSPFYSCKCPPITVALNQTKCVFPNYCDAAFPCPGNSVCVNGQCVCSFGFSWQEVTDFPLTTKSLLDRRACKEINPCLESQLCVDPLKCRHVGPGKHICECQSGFEQIEGECFDIDECNLNQGAAECPQLSKCVNLIGAYKCDCKKGYVAQLGSSLINPTCIDVNECEAGLDDCSLRNASCVNSIGSFECSCGRGYRVQAPDYTICRDIDECADDTDTCDKDNAFCQNTNGGFDCSCKKGYFGDGETCQDVDECNPSDPGHNCTETMHCVNLPGTFNCTCKSGFKLTEFGGCEDINECLSPDNNNCSKIGGEVRMKCVNEPGSYACVCPLGYSQLSSEQCTDINECDQVPSVCPAFEADVCVNTNGSFTCGCKTGYAKKKGCEDPTKCPCEDIDECKEGIHVDGKFKQACGPDAKCDNILGSFRCECGPGYSGDAYKEGCKISDPCKVNNPCDKETEDCVAAGDKAVCACKTGFLQTNAKTCQKNPCSINRGGCGQSATCLPKKVEEFIQAECRCKPGEKLDDKKECQKVDQCECKTPVPIGNPCKSQVRCAADHMLCVNWGDAANCTCSTGYKLSIDEKSCENIDECKEGVEANPKNIACDPQAKCFDTDGSFECDCPRGQIENHQHKCVPDVDCTREHGCKHDPNTFCSTVNASHIWCECEHGFEGTGLARDGLCQPENFCQVAEKAANGKPVCPPHEHCVNAATAFKCACDVGFERDQKTNECVDLDECKLGIHECRATYICNNTIGSFTCQCPGGYRENVTDHRCDDIDECREKTDDCEEPKEMCVNLPGSFKCECANPEYIRSPIGCVDNDECNTNQFECPEFSNCVNKQGGYDCICLKGFQAVVVDNKTAKCEDIDECKDPKSCPQESDCKNLVGSYQCICKPPTIQHGLQDCVKNASCPECHQFASCLKSVKEDGGVYNCTCNEGYSGDGVVSCKPVDECALGTHKCHKLAKCIDETPGYTCVCNEPLEGDGKNQCNLPDICKKYNDCPQDAECISLNGTSLDGHFVTCKCPKGFEFNTKLRQCDDVDECKDNDKACPQKPSGVECVNTQGSFYCKCPAGFMLSGAVCDDVDECLDKGAVTCTKQGAKCENTYGDYICNCPQGMRAGSDNKTCTDIDECAEKMDDCDKETTNCKNTIGSFVCQCLPGLALIPTKSNICEDINECELGLSNCKPFSELCHNTVGSFKCNCSNGYAFKDDQCVPFSDCDKDFECGANAFCVIRAKKEDPSKTGPECVCQDGYYGKDPKEFCDPVPDCEKNLQCPTNAKCVETQVVDKSGRAMFKCACDPGFKKVGSQCEPVNECQEHEDICNGTAICVDLTPGYRCECPKNQIDVGTGDNNVTCILPKCSDVKNPCHADADCIDNNHGIECKCKQGFRGVGTAQYGCEPIPYCEEYTPCSQYASCVNTPRGAFTCTCKSGYEGNGTICHDINECKTPGACDTEAVCHNTQGSFRCICNPGFEGTGLPGLCKDVDECVDPRLNKCDLKTASCVNTIGSFECQCLSGYVKSTESNYTCNDINECLDKENPVCGIHKCNNLPGSYRCECNVGYQQSSDGKKCQDINECDARPCHVQADCINTLGSYDCTCKEGFTGDGIKACEPINKCAKPELNSCDQKTTVCKQIENTARYRCDCLQGYVPPLNVTDVFYTCVDENECISGTAKYDPIVEDCENLTPGFTVTCKPGYERDAASQKCVDHDECADDPAYTETLALFEKAQNSSQKLGDWKQWMVKPHNDSSAYAICYSKAVASEYWWFTSSSSPLPFCKNTLYNAGGTLIGNKQIKEWRGFSCTCQPGNALKETVSAVRVVLKCDVSDPCEALKCPELGEGFVCNKERQICQCDSSLGYIERVGDKGSFCSKDECTAIDTQGPLTVSNIEHRSLIKCDLEKKRWREVKGYEFVRDNKTNAVIELRDINECIDENYCCNRVKAQCESHGGPNKCEMKCKNFDGGATCYCDLDKLDVTINRDTCQCMPKCAVNSAWYLTCDGADVKCDSSVWEKLAQKDTAPKGRICSRLVDDKGKYMTFPTILDLVKNVCSKKFYCAFPADEIDDIRKTPGFNYEGKCIEHRDQTSTVKCPFGDKAEPLDGVLEGAFCPFKIDTENWPAMNPEYQKRDGLSMPLNCLPSGVRLGRDILFLDDGDRYSMEAI